MSIQFRNTDDHPAPAIRRRGRSPFRSLVAAATILVTLPLAGLGVFQYWPGYAPPPAAPRVVVGDYVCEQPAMIDSSGRVYLSYSTVKSLFAPGIELDRDHQRVIIPTSGFVAKMPTPALTGFVASQQPDLNAPYTTDSAGVPYLRLDLFAALAGLEFAYHPEGNTVVVDRFGERVQPATVTGDDVALRETASLLSVKLGLLGSGDSVFVFGEEKGSYYVRDAEGRLGYVPGNVLKLDPPVTLTAEPDPNWAGPSPVPAGEKVTLVWEAITPNLNDISDMPGLNVVSPTWFSVVDTDGTVANLGDQAYVDWAHARGYKVWGLVTNGFSQSRTRAFLPDPAKRKKIIQQLLWYAQLYKLDGINLDFESMYLSEKDDYVALAQELTPLAHQMGLTVSVDVTFLSTSELWSRCFDRPALAQTCDYVMAMAYDEHTTSSNPGSVGSLPWVEYGMSRLLSEGGIPAEKLILGVPFYTRLWGQGAQRANVTYSMQGVKNLIAEKKLTPVYDSATGQNYITYKEDGTTYQLWIEDETSMAERVNLIHEMNLAGFAAWRRGFETPEMWQVIDRTLNGPG